MVWCPDCLLSVTSRAPRLIPCGFRRFSDQASTVFKLDTFYDKRQMQQAIDEMPFDGGLTNISGGVRVWEVCVLVSRFCGRKRRMLGVAQ